MFASMFQTNDVHGWWSTVCNIAHTCRRHADQSDTYPSDLWYPGLEGSQVTEVRLQVDHKLAFLNFSNTQW